MASLVRAFTVTMCASVVALCAFLAAVFASIVSPRAFTAITPAQRASMDAYSATAYPFLVVLHADPLTPHAGFVTRDAHNAAPCARNGARGACSVIVSADNVARGAEAEAVGSSREEPCAAGGARFRLLSTLSTRTAFSIPGSASHGVGRIVARVFSKGQGAQPAAAAQQDKKGKATPLPHPMAKALIPSSAGAP